MALTHDGRPIELGDMVSAPHRTFVDATVTGRVVRVNGEIVSFTDDNGDDHSYQGRHLTIVTRAQ